MLLSSSFCVCVFVCVMSCRGLQGVRRTKPKFAGCFFPSVKERKNHQKALDETSIFTNDRWSCYVEIYADFLPIPENCRACPQQRKYSHFHKYERHGILLSWHSQLLLLPPSRNECNSNPASLKQLNNSCVESSTNSTEDGHPRGIKRK